MPMNKTQQAKKPFWKRPLGIAVIILGIIVTLGITGVLDDKPTTTETPTVETTKAPATNVTEQIKNAAGPHADKITQALDQDNFIIVETTLVDPRGDHGSQPALDAIAICEAVKTLGHTAGRILEADGTTFVTLQQGTCEEQ